MPTTDNTGQRFQTTRLPVSLTAHPMDDQTAQTGKARLSITEAADLAGINRTYFYQKYITP